MNIRLGPSTVKQLCFVTKNSPYQLVLGIDCLKKFSPILIDLKNGILDVSHSCACRVPTNNTIPLGTQLPNVTNKQEVRLAQTVQIPARARQLITGILPRENDAPLYFEPN